ncbi:MAG: hypothetical protein RL292_187 [Candidatus Parcubacteria bacterium]|jgi:type II secretory pathway pseudopilin PulG
MENTQPRSHAKDVFLNLAALVALYSSVGALLSLLFTVIEKAYPTVNNYYSYYSPSISFPVATLIILFPLYILFMWLIEKDLTSSVEARMSGIRKWLVYITLFISGGLIVGDLVAVVYKFIDGQDLTAGFLYKALSIIVIAGMVFGYYITDARNKLTSRCKKTALSLATLLVVVAIIIGFVVIGSPKTQRLMKSDQAKVSDLQNLASQVRYFYDMSKTLPASFEELAQSNSYGGYSYVDAQTQVPYVYTIINPTTFELCAEFNLDQSNKATGTIKTNPIQGDIWGVHTQGLYCFRQIVGTSPTVKY